MTQNAKMGPKLYKSRCPPPMLLTPEAEVGKATSHTSTKERGSYNNSWTHDSLSATAGATTPESRTLNVTTNNVTERRVRTRASSGMSNAMMKQWLAINTAEWKHDIPTWLCPAVAKLVMLQEVGDRTKVTTTCPEVISSCFECVEVPDVSIVQYIAYLVGVCPSVTLWVRSMVLLDEFVKRSGLALTQFTVHRAVIAAVAATSIFLGNGKEAELCCGIDTADVNGMVQAFDKVLDGQYDVTLSACMTALLPFTMMPSASVFAAGILSLEATAGNAARSSLEERAQAWAADVVLPATEVLSTCCLATPLTQQAREMAFSADESASYTSSSAGSTILTQGSSASMEYSNPSQEDSKSQSHKRDPSPVAQKKAVAALKGFFQRAKQNAARVF